MFALPAKLPPGDDGVFRRLFDEENGCHLLICLLNAILAYPAEQRITKLTLVRNHVAGPGARDKEVILDVLAEAADKRRFHVELQVCSQPYYSERILFYWAGVYTGQLEAGQGYSDLRAVVSVHILFFRLFKGPKHAAYHHVFRLRADQDDTVLTPQLELHTVEMPKFPDRKEGAPGEKWLYWLKHGHEMTEQEVEKLGLPEIIEAERKLEMISQDRQAQMDYLRRRMAHHDAVALTRDYQQAGLTEGRQLGIDEGKRLGIDEGKRLGLVETLLEGLALRGFLLSEEQHARITAETDLARLKSWLLRVGAASAVEEVLNG